MYISKNQTLVYNWKLEYLKGKKSISSIAEPKTSKLPQPDTSNPTSDSAKMQNFDNNIGAFKQNGGTIINLCSRTMRVRSHAESTKNAANRVQADSDKLAIFWINQPETDPSKLSPQRTSEAIALVKKVHSSHAILLLEIENFIGLEKPGYLKEDYPGKVDW